MTRWPTPKAALKFLLERGKDLAKLEDMAAAGMNPQALHNRPDADLQPELRMMLDHFLALSRYRPISGMSDVPSAIPLHEIAAYHGLFGVGEYMEADEFGRWMMELDNMLIAHYTRLSELKK